MNDKEKLFYNVVIEEKMEEEMRPKREEVNDAQE